MKSRIASGGPVLRELVFLPKEVASEEDARCSCIICHTPRREEDGVERGKPVEFVIRMRLANMTIWQGLHLECWERNRVPENMKPGEPAVDAITESTFVREVKP